jgi:hypothetical protein
MLDTNALIGRHDPLCIDSPSNSLSGAASTPHFVIFVCASSSSRILRFLRFKVKSNAVKPESALAPLFS